MRKHPPHKGGFFYFKGGEQNMTDLEKGNSGAVEFSADKYAAREFLVTGFEDPRGVTGSAERAHRQTLEGHAETSHYNLKASVSMERGQVYEV